MVQWSEILHTNWDYSPEQCPASETYDYTQLITSTATLKTGGKGVPGRKNLVEIDVSAVDYDSPWPTPIPPGGISVQSNAPNANGQIYVVLPDGMTMDITPQASPQSYTYSFNVTKYPASFQVFVRQPWPNYPNDLIIWTLSDDPIPFGYPVYKLGGIAAGHAWWELSCGAPVDAMNQFTSTNYSRWMNIQAGYAPTNSSIDWWLTLVALSPIKEGPGCLDTDPGTPNVQRTYAIGFGGMLNGLLHTENLNENPGTWDSETHNCVQETIITGHKSGVNLSGSSDPEGFGFDLPPSDP
jgi:hypothetical protein